MALLIGPFHADAALHSGAPHALGMDVLAICWGVHMLGMLLTLPTLLGVRFGKCQAEKYPSFWDVLSALPLVSLNGALAWAFYTTCILTSVPVEANLADGMPSNTVMLMQGAFAVVMSEVLNF